MLSAASRAEKLSAAPANALYLQGQAHWSLGHHDEARRAYEKAIALEANVPLYRFRLAQLVAESDPALAEQHLQWVVDHDPTHARAINDLGVLFFRRGQLHPARECFARAFKLDPTLEAARRNTEALPISVAARVVTALIVALPIAGLFWLGAMARAHDYGVVAGVLWLAATACAVLMVAVFVSLQRRPRLQASPR